MGRFSFLRNKFLFGQSENHTTPESLGFQYSPSLPVAAGPPFIQVSGYTNIGNPITGPRNTYENLYNISGSLSWVRGKHAFKFGGGYQYQQINVTQGIATNGFFVFAPFPVTDAFASFLSGEPVVFLQGIGDFSRHIRGNKLNGYVQDTYKVSPRITINPGLRYELPMPYTELNNRQSLFVPGKQSAVMPNAPAGLLYPGDPGVPAGLIPTDKTAFAPRVGIAWDRSGDGKTLLTSAYGIFYEPYYTGQGGPLAGADQCASVPGDAAGEPAELCRSVQRQSAGPGDVLHATHEPDSVAELDTSLHAGLGPEPAAVVRS